MSEQVEQGLGERHAVVTAHIGQRQDVPIVIQDQLQGEQGGHSYTTYTQVS